jgi:hypothetical protein
MYNLSCVQGSATKRKAADDDDSVGGSDDGKSRISGTILI